MSNEKTSKYVVVAGLYKGNNFAISQKVRTLPFFDILIFK